MPGRRPLSQARQKHLVSTDKGLWEDLAVELYKGDRIGPNARPPESVRSWDTVIKAITARCAAETGRSVVLSKSTLAKRYNGRPSIREFNASKRLLWPAEEQVVLDHMCEMAHRGFPLSHRRLEELVNEILRGRSDGTFDTVGKGWTSRFADTWADVLSSYRSRALETARARAGNPYSKEAHFTRLRDIREGRDGKGCVDSDLVFGSDETGLQSGIGKSEVVFGPRGQRVQHQQRSGNRENITVTETICADGTTLPPAVIYAGTGYQASWHQNNPLNASLGYTESSYMNGSISAIWIKHFDAQTREKAGGRRRLLLVDGHKSHYETELLRYAKDNNIAVLCYPSHGTHLYQGLDVVLFSPLKIKWTQARDDWERTRGTTVSKRNFLEVYANARVQIMTESNIKAAFRKTGVEPYNPEAIAPEKLAPSKALSREAQPAVRQASPIRVMAGYINDVLGLGMSNHDESIAVERSANEWPPSPHTPSSSPRDGSADSVFSTPTRHHTQHTLDRLSKTSSGFLASSARMSASASVPKFAPTTISPVIRGGRYRHLLDEEPGTNLEGRLIDALQESDQRDVKRKEAMVGMQGSTLLHSHIATRVQRQLQDQEEEKENKKTNGKAKVPAPSTAQGALLTGPEWDISYGRWKNAREEAEEDKIMRTKKREEYSEKLEEWKAADKERLARNKQLRESWEENVMIWQGNYQLALDEGLLRSTAGPRPKRGPAEKPIPRPKMNITDAASEDGAGMESDGINGESD